jgi:hypothetical protein
LAVEHQRFPLVLADSQAYRLSGLLGGGFACRPPYDFRPGCPTPGSPSLPRPSIANSVRYRNINLLSIDYAFRPRLRLRLTPGGRSCPRETLDLRCPEFSSGFSLLIPACSLACSPRSVVLALRPAHDAFLPIAALAGGHSAASVPDFSPDHLRRGIARPVSCYALFK